MTSIEASAPRDRRHLLTACLLSLCTLIPGLAGADVYKWTGDDGKINYTQMPPPSGYHSELIRESYTPQAAPEHDNGFISTTGNLEERLEEEQRDRQDDAARAETEKQNTEIKRLNCDAATRNLAALEQPGQRKYVKANGEFLRPTEQERKKLIADAKKQVKVYCGK